MSATHEVELCIPADPAFVRIARLTASGVAALIPFDVERIDDLRITVDEICSTLVEVGRGTIRLAFVVDGSSITVHAKIPLDTAGEIDADRFGFTEQIIDVLADSHEFIRTDSDATFRATLEAGTQESAGAR